MGSSGKLSGQQDHLAVADQFKKLMSEFERIYGDHSAAYVSLPVTSGRRLFEVLRKYDLPLIGEAEGLPMKIRMDEVVRPNVVAAKRCIEELSLKGPIINPTLVMVPGATQREYRCFWRYVISRKVACVVVVLDWSFSYGCLYEVALALRLGLPIRSVTGNLLGRREIEEAIWQADRELGRHGFPGRPLTSFWNSCQTSLISNDSCNG